MLLSQAEFYQQGQQFIRDIVASMEGDTLFVAQGSIDHVCYRSATPESYHQAKQQLASWGRLLSENQVGGRPIAVYQLARPIVWEGHAVVCLELASPKKGRHYAEGFEHIEVVTPLALTQLMENHPQLAWDTKGMNKPLNADLRLMYPIGAVKFHNQSLEQVIEIESQFK